MNCLECQDLLQERLDGRSIAESAEVDAHLSQCATCREQHAAALRLLEGLKEMPRPSVPSGLAQSLAAAVISDRRQRRDKTRRRVFVTMALAASVLLVLFMAYYWIPRTPVAPVIVKDGPKKETPKEIVPEKLAKKPEEPRNRLTPLMDRWAGATRDHAKVVMVGTNLDAVGDNLPAVDNFGPIDPGVREASQEVSDGVRTVTRNARKAFDFFVRELPMPELGEQKH